MTDCVVCKRYITDQVIATCICGHGACNYCATHRKEKVEEAMAKLHERR